MLTKITIRNFKRFGQAEIELGNPVVFIGPNNSGKTSAMQALALWDIGVKRWDEKRSGKGAPERRSGVTVNRRDLVSIPIPDAHLLWHKLRIRNARMVEGKQHTTSVYIDIIVEGTTEDVNWRCGLEFYYANPESLYCRPLRLGSNRRMQVPPEAVDAKIAFLPPMSGLADTETRLDDGAINVRIGEGRTAEVLRNLCYRVQQENPEQWETIKGEIQRLFGVGLNEPRYIAGRGEIVMDYKDQNITLDISSSGRGLQQTLLLLAYMRANPGAVLLLDEPDAHLEILRQRQTYRLISDRAADSGSQIVAASHSEVLLNEAADKDSVIAFIGKPHPIAGRGNLQGVAIFDRLESRLKKYTFSLLTWKKREIENYMCTKSTLKGYVRASVEKEFSDSPSYSQEKKKRMNAMRESIAEVAGAMETLGHGSPWDADTKTSDDFLTPLFRAYFKKLKLHNPIAKKSFYELAEHVPENAIDPEIRKKLDAIVKAAKAAKPG